MVKGRRSFTFTVNDVSKAQALVNEWLQVYKFAPVNKNGEQVYRGGNIWSGYYYFLYQIVGNIVTVWAWQKNLFGGEIDIYAAPSLNSNYRDLVNALLAQLELLDVNKNPQAAQGYNATGVAGAGGQTGNSVTSGNVMSAAGAGGNMVGTMNAGADFRAASDKADSIAAILALVLAIASLALALLDGPLAMGGLGYLLILAAGIRGMKSSKKPLAILALALGLIALVIFIIKVIK